MKLYSVPLSPFASRARLSVYRKGLEDRIEIAPPPEGGTRGEAFLAITPLGQVPTLVLDNGTAIPESAAIIEYLEDAFPEPSLRPANPAALARARLFLRLPDIYFQNAPRTLLAARDPAAREPDVIETAFGHLNRTLSFIDHYLEGGPWAVGDRASIADSALVPVLNIVDRVAMVYELPDLIGRHAKLGRYWQAAQAEPVNARVIGEQRAAAPRS